MSWLRQADQTEQGGLLRVLLIRNGEMSASSGIGRLLQWSAMTSNKPLVSTRNRERPCSRLTHGARAQQGRALSAEHPEADMRHIVRGIVRRGLRPVPPKASIALRLDADVLEWFKAQGSGYQTRINAVLRAFKDASL